jgi:hypothetical protein
MKQEVNYFSRLLDFVQDGVMNKFHDRVLFLLLISDEFGPSIFLRVLHCLNGSSVCICVYMAIYRQYCMDEI